MRSSPSVWTDPYHERVCDGETDESGVDMSHDADGYRADSGGEHDQGAQVILQYIQTLFC